MEKLLTLQIVSLLTTIHEFNGRQSLFIEANSDKIEGIITLHDRLKISSVEIRLRTLGQKLGINKVHSYKFRRMAATKAIDKGMSIYLASFI